VSDAPTIRLPAIFDQYSTFVNGCANLNYYSRALALQEQKIFEIGPRVVQMKAYKAQAVDRGEEELAKVFFHFQCMLRSVESALRVWVAIKGGDIDEGWRHLVDAQEYKDIAILAGDGEGVRTHERQLVAMEQALFPPSPLFNSAGFSESIGDCSICGSPFSSCSHIENFIYMGRLCRRTNKKFIAATHVALVEHPRDRRCVVTKQSNDEGRMINRFTLEDSGANASHGDGAMMLEAVLMTSVELDFD
jgi:hypothetical protein